MYLWSIICDYEIKIYIIFVRVQIGVHESMF